MLFEELCKEESGNTPSAEVKLGIVSWDLDVGNVEFLTTGRVDDLTDG